MEKAVELKSKDLDLISLNQFLNEMEAAEIEKENQLKVNTGKKIKIISFIKITITVTNFF